MLIRTQGADPHLHDHIRVSSRLHQPCMGGEHLLPERADDIVGVDKSRSLNDLQVSRVEEDFAPRKYAKINLFDRAIHSVGHQHLVRDLLRFRRSAADCRDGDLQRNNEQTTAIWVDGFAHVPHGEEGLRLIGHAQCTPPVNRAAAEYIERGAMPKWVFLIPRHGSGWRHACC